MRAVRSLSDQGQAIDMSFPGLGGGMGGGQRAGLTDQQMQEQQMIKYVCCDGVV